MADSYRRQEEPLTDSEVRNYCDQRYNAATNYRDTEVATRRKIVRDYYDGKPLGNEISDRSQAIQFEVRTKVEGILPGLIDVFFGEEDVVTLTPDDEVYEDLLDESGQLDEQQVSERVQEIAQIMRDATDHVNDVFLKAPNQGFLVSYTAMKDALMEITGIIKVWVEETEHESVERRTGMFDDEMDDLMDAEDIELRDISDPYDVEVAGEIEDAYDADVVTKKMRKRIRIGVIPPEDFGIDDDAVATDRKSWRYMYHARLATRTELIEEGYDADLVYSIPAYQGAAGTTGTTGVTVTRRRSNTDYDSHLEPSQEEVRVVEHYMYLDVDGDGIGEPRKICIGGNAGGEGVTLDNDEWDDDWPFYVIQPIVRPHEFFGVAFGELATNHQLIGSTILREWYDNIYGANNNRYKVFDPSADSSLVDMAAVYAKRQDTPMRIRAEPGKADVVPLPHVDLGPSILPLLEYQDRRSEIDTGVSRYSAGISDDDLNQTAHGMERITTKSEERQALIARMFAETGFNAVFMAIYQLSRKYLAGPRPHARDGQVRVIDPGTWPAAVNIQLEAGSGYGSPMERRANAMALVELAERAQKYGYVSQSNGYHAYVTAIRALGYPSAVPYSTDPSTPAGQKEQQRIAQQREKQGEAMETLAKAEMAKVEQRHMEAMSKQQAEILKLQAQVRDAQESQKLDVAKFLADQQQYAVDTRLEVRKVMSEIALKIAELQLQAGRDVNLARDQDVREALDLSLGGQTNGGSNGSGGT